MGLATVSTRRPRAHDEDIVHSNLNLVSRGRRFRTNTSPDLSTMLVLVFTCLLQLASARSRYTTGFTVNVSADDREVVLADQTSTHASQLQCLEIVPPVVTPPTDGAACSHVLMVHSFANSYGRPFVGPYSPPDCQFDRVILNLTVEGAGRQFDRLAIAYLGDTEIWRTSTAEPTAAPGIVWTYVKDVTPYLSLWKQPQALIFDLGNLVNDIYTSPFNATLTATFFNAAQSTEFPPADVIIPLSSRQSSKGAPSAFALPGTRAINEFTIPKIAKRAIFSISACGQMDEEFWWSNAPDSTTSTFGNKSTLLGHSPFREVQLLIDGQLAGLSWPFPVIFTGGVVPGFWRPLVGIDAFDLREDEIDVTPWLPLLSDGRAHSYEIRVLGLSDDGSGNAKLSTIGGYWVVTGKLFLWLDTTGFIASGPAPSISATEPHISITSNTGNSKNTTLEYHVTAHRNFTVSNTIRTSSGERKVSWSQTLRYSNFANLVANGANQTTSMTIAGTDVSSSGYTRKFTYPLSVFNAFTKNENAGGFTLDGNLDRSKNVHVVGNSVFTSPLDAFTQQDDFDGWSITNRQNGTAFYFNDGNSSGSAGITEQEFALKGVTKARRGEQQQKSLGSTAAAASVPLYSRHILAANNSIITDTERGVGAASDGVSPVSLDLKQLRLSEFALIPISSSADGEIVRRLNKE